MASVVPQPDYWFSQIVFVAQRTHARGAQHEESPERGIEPEPTSGKHSQEMRAGEKQYVGFDLAHTFHNSVCAHTNVVRRFASRATIAKQLPTRPLLQNVRVAR
jgi:hypothetical protein